MRNALVKKNAVIVLILHALLLPALAQERAEPRYRITVKKGRVVDAAPFDTSRWYQASRAPGPASELQQVPEADDLTWKLDVRLAEPGAAPPEKGQLQPLMGRASITIEPGDRGRSPRPAQDARPLAQRSTAVVAPGWQNIVVEDFEYSFPYAPWDVHPQSGYTDAYWDESSYRPHGGSRSAWCADAGSQSGPAGGPYPHNMRAWMEFGPFDLTDATEAELVFYLWLRSESGRDVFHYVAGTDGSSYSGPYLSGDVSGTTGWVQRTLDLSAYVGQATVWVAFVFRSDDSIAYEGAYVDDIVLRKYVADVPPADLVASSYSISPGWVWGGGQSITLGFTERNAGGATAGPHESRLVLSHDYRDLVAGATLLCTLNFTSILGGQRQAQSCTFPAPAVPDGIYYLHFLVDTAGDVPESNDNNHWYLRGVRYGSGTGPDLVAVGWNTSTDTWVPGRAIRITLHERNTGDAPAGPHRTQNYLSPDEIITTADLLLGAPLSFDAMEPGVEQVQSVVTVVPDVPAGTYYLGSLLDIDDDVEESDEYNTYYVRSRQYPVIDPPDVAVSTTALTATVQEGQVATQTLTLRNEGEGPLAWSVIPYVDAPAGVPSSARLDYPVVAQALSVRERGDDIRPLLARAEAQGSVPVIVGVRAAFRPEGTLPATAAQRQRTSIAEAVDGLLAHVAGRGATLKRRFRYVPFVAMRVEEPALERLYAHPDVLSIREDGRMQPHLAESVSLIGADRAWAEGFSGAGQAVAILDTGVDTAHPFVETKIVAEACFSTTDPTQDQESLCPDGSGAQIGPGASVDPGGHGTHVAGIAAGAGESFSGVARDAGIIAVQVFSRYTSESICGLGRAPCYMAETSDVIAGLEHVYELRTTLNIAAANLSLGGGWYAGECDVEEAAYKAAADNLRSAGIATVTSSGNSGWTDAMGSPACISSVVSVGSTDDGSDFTIPDGVSAYSNSNELLDLLAPGRWIVSSVPGGGYDSYSGTSMSSPHVAGAWAVLKSRYPAANVDEILGMLSSSGIPITDPRNGLTRPRIQLDAAVGASVWLAASPRVGDLEAGGEETVTVAMSAAGLAAGTYTGALMIRSNDPDEDSVEVTVRLTVEEVPPAGQTLAVKALLEGPCDGTGTMITAIGGHLPLVQPYGGAPWYYAGSEHIASIPTDVVDWVLVELRTGTAEATVAARQAALLRSDGTVVSHTDAASPLHFTGLAAGRYYVVVRHRNHLPVMSASAVDLTTGSGAWDFTTTAAQAFGTNATKEVAPGVWVLFAGDGDASGGVTAADQAAWLGVNGFNGYLPGDYDISGGVTAADQAKWLTNNGVDGQVPDG